jgi:chaperonin GroES
MKIKPLFDRVVLSPIENQNETKGGIFLPASTQEKSQLAIVVAVGDGMTTDGKDVGMQVEKGDKVLYGKYAGTEITIEDKKYILIRQVDILAIIKE